MILKVIKDITPFSKGAIVSASNYFKYNPDADIFNRLEECSFEEADFIRVDTQIGMFPKENFIECTLEITNSKHQLYRKSFNISSIIMEDVKQRIEYDFVYGVIDPTLIKELKIEHEGNIVSVRLTDVDLSFINSEEIRELKEFLAYIDREEYKECFTNEWDTDEVETSEDTKIAEEKSYFIHNTGTMALQAGVEYEITKFMKKDPATNEYLEVSESKARVAQVIANGNFVTVLLRNGIIRKH